MIKYLLAILALTLYSSTTFACGGFGNPNDGCADQINGIEIWHDGTLEIDVQGHVTWYPTAACSGMWSLQFRGDSAGIAAKTSVALMAYTTNKPITFRCDKKLGIYNRECECQFLVIGKHWRD